jgi:hypothetical protein
VSPRKWPIRAEIPPDSLEKASGGCNASLGRPGNESARVACIRFLADLELYRQEDREQQVGAETARYVERLAQLLHDRAYRTHRAGKSEGAPSSAAATPRNGLTAPHTTASRIAKRASMKRRGLVTFVLAGVGSAFTPQLEERARAGQIVPASGQASLAALQGQRPQTCVRENSTARALRTSCMCLAETFL